MRSTAWCLATALFTFSSAAAADAVELSGGVKLAGGGNLWTGPSNVPQTAPGRAYDGIGFPSDGGGVGYGAGLYLEGRAIKFLGLETGVAYDSSNVWRNVTYNGVYGLKEKFSASSVRIPLLAKLILPLGFGRASFGIGPEFIVPLSASASVEQTSGPSIPVTIIANARTAGSTMLTTDFGLVIAPPFGIEIPIDLRISKNLSQPDAWFDRVSLDSNNAYTVQAQSSWDFRLLAGIGMKLF